MKKILFFVPFLLQACQNEPIVKIEKIQVPVIQYPYIEIPEKPDLDIFKITNKSSSQQIIKYYGRSVDQLINYSNLLYNIIQQQNELSVKKNISNTTEN